MTPTDAKRYLNSVSFASGAGDTMQRQGEAAINNLHPDFAVRLAGAIQQARAENIPAFVFSAYRPPGLGVGGFSDKYNSMHAYGMGVDIGGIGGSSSTTAQKWYKIATENGIFNPYGPRHQKEWNHYQMIPDKVAPDALRATINEKGPINPEVMWAVGSLVAAGPDAIKEYQRTHTGPDGKPLAVDGVIGPNTRYALSVSPPSSPSPAGGPLGGLMAYAPIANATNAVRSAWNALTAPAASQPATPPLPLPRPAPPVPLPTYEQGLAQRPGAPTRSTNVTSSAGATGLPFMPLPQPRPSPPQSRAETNVLPSGLWASGIPAAPLPTPRPAAPTPAAQPSAYSMPAPRFGPGSQTGTSPMSRDVTQGVTQPRTSGFALPAPAFGAGSMTGTPINVPVAAPPPPVVSTKTIPATYKTVQSLGSAAGAAGNALLKGANAAANVFGNVFGGNPLAQAGWPSTPQRVVATPARTLRTVTPAPLPVSTPGRAWNGQFLSAPPQGATNANTYYDATTGKWQTYRPQSQSSNSGFRSGSNWSGYSSAPPAGSSNSNTYYDRTTGTWGSY